MESILALIVVLSRLRAKRVTEVGMNSLLQLLVFQGYLLFPLTAQVNANNCSQASIIRHGKHPLPLSLTPESLKTVLSEKAAPENYVIISTWDTNLGEDRLYYLRNYYQQFLKVQMIHKVMLFCTTCEQCLDAWKSNLPLFWYQNANASPSHPVRLKWSVANAILKQGYDVFYTNIEVGLNSNISHDFADTNFDLFLIPNIAPQAYWLEPSRYASSLGSVGDKLQCASNYRQPSTCFSSSLWYARSTPQVQFFYEAMYDATALDDEENALNELLFSFFLGDNGTRGLSVNALPFPRYATAAVFENLHEKALVTRSTLPWSEADIAFIDFQSYSLSYKLTSMRRWKFFEPTQNLFKVAIVAR